MRNYLIVVLLLVCQVGMTQTGDIQGRVASSDGRAVEEVNISIPALKRNTVSGADGRFVFHNIEVGAYSILFSYAGYEGQEMQVVVKEGKKADIDFVFNQTARQLDEVVITAGRGLNKQPLTIGKIPIAPHDLPQAVSIIDRKLLESQQAQRLSDAIRNVNGVYLADARANTQEIFYARGYRLNSNNIFVNGIRINSGSMPEMSSLEKVEVLKGSGAILYGNVEPGAVINLVTKRPAFNWGGELSMRAGSYGLYKPTVDLYGPISDKLAFRVNGTYEAANSFRETVQSKRAYINPSLLYKFNDRSELLIQGDYLRHDFTPDFGLGTVADTIIPNVPRQRFYGTDWQYAHTRQATANAVYRQKLAGSWQLNITGGWQRYSRDYYAVERIQADADGNWARPLGRNNTAEQYFIGQVDLTGKFATGKLEHTLLTGIDAENYSTRNYNFQLSETIYDTINLYEADKSGRRSDIPEATALSYRLTPVFRSGAYVQDLVHLSKKWVLLAGLRWSMQQTGLIDTVSLSAGDKTTGGQVARSSAFSPRLGIVFKPSQAVSLFSSYANSFAVNSGTDIYGNALKPSIIDQYELGVKSDLISEKLAVNLTFYRIINNNLAQTAPFLADGVTQNNNSNIKELTGQTTSDGLELDIQGHPLPGLDITAGYSYNYMRYTKTKEASRNFVVGERLVNNPAHTANASIFYSWKGFRVGAGYQYVGERYGGWNNRVGQTQNYDRRIAVSAFSTVDLSAGYTYKKISAMLKLSNLTNSYNYYVHENYSINPIAPRQWVSTLRYRF